MDEEGFDTPPAIAQAEDDEHVGYGRPPVRTRFKAGQSGNPAGRPKGSRNRSPTWELDRAQKTALAEAYREIRVTDGGEVAVVTMLQAVWRALMTKAAKGDLRSIKYAIDKTGEFERQREAQAVTNLEAAAGYQREAYAEIERYEAAGRAPPEIYPHPDDMRFDFDSGIVDFIGPREPEERETWDQIDNILLTESSIAAEAERLERALEDSGPEFEEALSLRERLKLVKRLQRRLAVMTASMPPEDKAWRLRRLAKAGRGKS